MSSFKRKPQTHHIARCSSRSVSASSASRNPSPEALSLSSSRESEKESVGSDSKTPTAPKVITGKLSSKRLPPLKLPAAFPEGKASTMSWDNQIAAKEGNNMVSRAENIPKSIQLPQAPILGLLNMIHRSAELSSYLGNQNITHNNELWNSEHHALSLSGYSEHLETDTMSGAVHTGVEVHRMDSEMSGLVEQPWLQLMCCAVCLPRGHNFR